MNETEEKKIPHFIRNIIREDLESNGKQQVCMAVF
jgi:hypothetical protein